MILQDYIESFKQRYNRKYLSFKEEFLSSGLSEILTNSLFYTPDSGGKLLRSIFAFRSCEIFEVPYEISENLAIALELFQSFTLIHDDLPSLDNDDFRRGKASLHRAFDTPTAILTGDALSLLTFTLFTKPFISKEFSRKLKKSTKPNSSNLNHPIFSRWYSGIIDLIHFFSSDVAVKELIDGQILDTLNSKNNLDIESYIKIYEKKTGSLFGFSFAAGAILAKNQYAKEKLYSAGLAFGIAFQIMDDFQDINKENETNLLCILEKQNAQKLFNSYKKKALTTLYEFDPEILYSLAEETLKINK